MPIITKTVTGDEDTSTEFTTYRTMYLHMAKAMAEAVGTSLGEINDAPIDADHERQVYYVSMQNIGYPGWFVVFNVYTYDSGNNAFGVGIYSADSSGTAPNLDDENAIIMERTSQNYTSSNDRAGKPETCVMIHDNAKDTVLFDIHNGETLHGTELSTGVRDTSNMYTLFLARDVNEGVLCGLGAHHIAKLRMTESSVNLISSVKYIGLKKTQSHQGLSNILQLTKMVNYLSEGYPEMKSAYVSVIRPIGTDIATNKRVPVYNLGWEEVAGVGETDWACQERNVGTRSDYCYFPINPLVDY